MTAAAATCSVAGCDQPVETAGLCTAHRKRRDRHRPLDAPIRVRAGAEFDRVMEGAIALADAEGDDEYRAAKDRHRKAAEAWMRARGWMPLEEAEALLRSRGWSPPPLVPVRGPPDNGRMSKTGT